MGMGKEEHFLRIRALLFHIWTPGPRTLFSADGPSMADTQGRQRRKEKETVINLQTELGKANGQTEFTISCFLLLRFLLISYYYSSFPIKLERLMDIV